MSSSLEVDIPSLVKQFGSADVLKQRIASLVPADRGTRFPGDQANVAVYIERSKNKNIVCYAAQCDKENTKELNAKAPVDAYWLDIDPEYVKANRDKGKMDDREELNLVDRTMAYGHSASEPIVTTEGLVYFTLSFVALSSRKMQFLLAGEDGTAPAMLCVIGGEVSIAVRLYVKAKEPKHFWNLPTVEYVELFGISIRNGEPTYEKLVQ
mmetsp:Transcript_57447/g.65882  ORF Transcript_57447/g.65882 Transcript_57447/m.65882 type:complete len:210 (+) Transcript_57447:40-669(+)